MTQIVSLPDVTAPMTDRVLQAAGALRGAEFHGGALSIGNFDGVHLGHASLLRQTKQLADKVGGPAIACLFDPHPIAILRPELAPKRLTSVAERARRMETLGIDFLVVCQTSPKLLNLSAVQFFEALVCNTLKCRGMVEGANFCFGKNRRGDVDLLTELCRQHQIEFRIAEMQLADGEMISSTRIRDCLGRGDVRSARLMMASPHSITGTVSHGDRRGRTIGFPTANLEDVDEVIPAPGVYAGIASTDDADHPAAIHIGESPTFGSGNATKVEVHLIDFDGDLYGQSLRVELIDRVREIIRFESAQALAQQLRQDIQSAQLMLDQHQHNQTP